MSEHSGVAENIAISHLAQREVLRCAPTATVIEAAGRMHAARCGSIVVVEGDIPVGIWTEHDALKLDFRAPHAFDVTVDTVMSSPVKSVRDDTLASEVGVRFKEDSVRHYLVVDAQGALSGIVSQTDLVLKRGVESYLYSRDARYMRDVGAALSGLPVVLPGAALVADVVERMRQVRATAAIIAASDGDLGIITERDVLRLVATRCTAETAWAVATKPLIAIRQDATLLQARELLEMKGVRHLGVLNADRVPMGLLSLSDILSAVQFEYIHRLEDALKERDRALQRSQKNLSLAHQVIDASPDAIMIVSADGRIEMVNPSFTRVTGYEAQQVIGESPSVLSSGRHEREFYRQMWETLEREGSWQGEIWNKRKDGEIYPEWLAITVLRDVHGGIDRYTSVFTDISERKKSEEKINSLAYYDPLTGLPNQRLYMDRLAAAVAMARRKQAPFAVMFVNLDMFKRINESLGHRCGDQILKDVAQRLSGAVREGDTVARMGSDEFTVLLPEIHEAEHASRCARQIIDAVDQPFTVGGTELFVTCSLGASVYPDDGRTVEALIKNAHSAMYRAKEAGRNSYKMYSAAMNARAFESLAMETSLRHAVDRNEFVLDYQPKVSMISGRVTGMEALIRWQHPELGLVSPGDFILIAEKTGLIAQMGEWVLRAAAVQAKAWQDAGHAPLRMAVNISPLQFQHADVVEAVTAALQDSGLAPEWLELEVTESTLMEQIEDAIVMLSRLREKGVRVSIDDFGTGYSSLSYLKRMPLDALKIDSSFVADIGTDNGNTLVATIIAMARVMGLKVVAEGVETRQQLAFLREAACDQVQGFLVSRPLSPDKLVELFGRDLLAPLYAGA